MSLYSTKRNFKKGNALCVALLQMLLIMMSCTNLYSNNLYPLQINGKYGYINNTGKLVIEPTFDTAYQFKEGRAFVIIDDDKYFVNEFGEIVFEIVDRSEREFSQGMVAFSKDGKWGFLDINGKVIIEPYWNRTSNFSCDLALVKTDQGDYSYITKDGDLAFGQMFFDMGYDFSEGVAIVLKQVYPDTYVDHPQRNARLRVSGLRRGVINTEGELIVPFVFRSSSDKFSEGLAIASLEKEYHPLGYVLAGYINNLGVFVLDPIFTLNGYFKEGLAPASTSELYGFIDIKGDFVVPEKFEQLQSLSEGLAVFTLDGKYGYVNRLGEIIIQNRFDFAKSFEKGFGFVRLGNDSGYIDHNGNVFWASDYE